jgi:hypothetical protein
MADEVAPGRWLLLVHQLPARPSNLRVHVWRRLQQVGAVALRNSIYVLPNNPESREDFEWVRAEIAARGGQVSILAAQVVDGVTDDELEAAFRAARTSDFVALIKDVRTLEKRLAAKSARLSRTAMQRAVGKARDRFHALQAIDFFGAFLRRRSCGRRESVSRTTGACPTTGLAGSWCERPAGSTVLSQARVGDASSPRYRSHGVSLADPALRCARCEVCVQREGHARSGAVRYAGR